MAHSVEGDLEVAQRIYDIAINEHGLKPEDLVYDTLTFTIATGDPGPDVVDFDVAKGKPGRAS